MPKDIWGPITYVMPSGQEIVRDAPKEPVHLGGGAYWWPTRYFKEDAEAYREKVAPFPVRLSSPLR